MAVSIPAGNSRADYNLQQIQLLITNQNAVIAALAAGSPTLPAAMSKLNEYQVNLVDALMAHGKLQAATIISTCSFTLNANSNQPGDYELTQALAAINSAIAQANATTSGTTFRNHDDGHVRNLQIRYVDLLMHLNRVSAATILSTCSYGQ